MTSFAKALPFFFVLVLFSSLLKVEARQRFFFSKVTHKPEIPFTEDPSPPATTPTYSPLYAPTYAPAPELTQADAPEGALLVPAPAPFDAEPELGYELYSSADQENEVGKTQANGEYENTNLYNDNSEGGYTNNYIDGKESFTNNYYSNNANGNKVDGFQENGSYYPNDDVKNENDDKLNGYQSSNEGYSEKRNVFNTMEEYEKYQENQGYMP